MAVGGSGNRTGKIACDIWLRRIQTEGLLDLIGIRSHAEKPTCLAAKL